MRRSAEWVNVAEQHRKGPDSSGGAPVGRYLGYGLAWAVSVALFLALGWLVDGWLGTMPLFTILGVLIGAGAGMINLYNRVVVEPRERGKRERERDAKGQ